MWWWLLPLAPGVSERLIVGREREFLTWFYEGASADKSAIDMHIPPGGGPPPRLARKPEDHY